MSARHFDAQLDKLVNSGRCLISDLRPVLGCIGSLRGPQNRLSLQHCPTTLPTANQSAHCNLSPYWRSLQKVGQVLRRV
jgi:hypothetical protein